ncbi:unnamed protein product [Bursaphelenchus okinawaensis]|uniref:Uncharacterized protein n=1 Tax=Bursaphelenchus okinawaensis TaxID=465554 RepID=A0A811K7C8_9BILA|nr:unnamed protein product [Bursaphelenchus okinawaensis]CAG9093326.1 unnamed protein product [Bursaphelenchus okinawaensis]
MDSEVMASLDQYHGDRPWRLPSRLRDQSPRQCRRFFNSPRCAIVRGGKIKRTLSIGHVAPVFLEWQVRVPAL